MDVVKPCLRKCFCVILLHRCLVLHQLNFLLNDVCGLVGLSCCWRFSCRVSKDNSLTRGAHICTAAVGVSKSFKRKTGLNFLWSFHGLVESSSLLFLVHPSCFCRLFVICSFFISPSSSFCVLSSLLMSFIPPSVRSCRAAEVKTLLPPPPLSVTAQVCEQVAPLDAFSC